MPIPNLSSPFAGATVEELTNLMFQYYRELQYLLGGQLDTQNIREITTDKLVAGTALIDTALIETLVVGGNVTMGPDAYISWANVTDQPTIPTQYTDFMAVTAWEASTYKTQLDGKIETYYTDTDPNTWPSGDRAKHDGDMWYAITAKLLKRYNGTSNAWELVEDQKAIDAYTNASTAQDTADGKRRVFTSTPTTPYDVGDMWAAGPTGDLKRCKTQRLTGAYNAADWELATKYNLYSDSDALTAWEASGYATYIDGNGVYSGSFNGGMFNVNPTGSPTLPSGITIGGYHYVNGTQSIDWSGEAFRIAYVDAPGQSGGPYLSFTTANGYYVAFDLPIRCNDYIMFFDGVQFRGAVSFYSTTIDFTGATVANFPGYTHTHDDRYYTETEADARFSRPLYAGNECYLDYNGANLIQVRKKDGTSVGVITIDP